MMNEEQAIMDYEAHNAATALALNKAEQEIERLQARIEKLEAVVEAYEQCRVIIVNLLYEITIRIMKVYTI